MASIHTSWRDIYGDVNHGEDFLQERSQERTARTNTNIFRTRSSTRNSLEGGDRTAIRFASTLEARENGGRASSRCPPMIARESCSPAHLSLLIPRGGNAISQRLARHSEPDVICCVGYNCARACRGFPTQDCVHTKSLHRSDSREGEVCHGSHRLCPSSPHESHMFRTVVRSTKARLIGPAAY